MPAHVPFRGPWSLPRRPEAAFEAGLRAAEAGSELPSAALSAELCGGGAS